MNRVTARSGFLTCAFCAIVSFAQESGATRADEGATRQAAQGVLRVRHSPLLPVDDIALDALANARSIKHDALRAIGVENPSNPEYAFLATVVSVPRAEPVGTNPLSPMMRYSCVSAYWKTLQPSEGSPHEANKLLAALVARINRELMQTVEMRRVELREHLARMEAEWQDAQMRLARLLELSEAAEVNERAAEQMRAAIEQLEANRQELRASLLGVQARREAAMQELSRAAKQAGEVAAAVERIRSLQSQTQRIADELARVEKSAQEKPSAADLRAQLERARQELGQISDNRAMMIVELQKVVEVREAQLQRARDLAVAAAMSESEVRDAALPLAAARVELMRELEAAASPQAGASEALQQMLRNAALERAELEARISFNEARIAEATAKLRDALANRPDRRELIQMSAAQREVEAVSERVADLRSLLESLRSGPIVELVGESEAGEDRK